MKPERMGEGRLQLLVNLENSKVITVRQPKKGVWKESGKGR